MGVRSAEDTKALVLARFIREAVTDGDVRAHSGPSATDFTRGLFADEADPARKGTEHRRRSVQPGFRAWLRLPA